MDILFSVHIKNEKQARTCQRLLDLISLQNKVDVLISNNKYKREIETQYKCFFNLDLIKSNRYDLVLIFNKIGLVQIKQFVRLEKLPVIYLLNATDIEQEYPNDLNWLSKVVLLNPIQNFPQALFQKDEVIPLQVPPRFFDTQEYEIRNRKKPKLLVSIESDNLLYSPLYQLIPLLNTLQEFEIRVIHEGMPARKIANTNISFIRNTNIDFKGIINKSDIILGSGTIIHEAISNCKPCIIVGERGYGGILTPECLSFQFDTGFQGRIGGYIGEYIPGKLVREKIKDILEMDIVEINNLLNENREFIYKKCSMIEGQLNGLLECIVNRTSGINNRLKETNLWFNKALEFSPLTKEDQFALVDKITRKVYCSFDKEGTEIIKFFKRGCLVKEAMVKSGYKEEPELFTDFIHELIKDKILLTDGS